MLKDVVFEKLIVRKIYNDYGLSNEDQGQLAILYDGRDITTKIDTAAREITGEIPYPVGSLFSLVAPMRAYDKIAPETTPGFRKYESGGRLYAAPQISLQAVELPNQTVLISGTATTYYLVDAAPDEACLLTPHTASAPFVLGEGEHALHYFSVDNAGNYESFKSTVIYVDGTAPTARMTAAGAVLTAATTVYIADNVPVSITAEDPASNGVAAGVRHIYYLTDSTPQSCEGIAEDPSAPGGTCANPESV